MSHKGRAMARAEKISCHCNECGILVYISLNDWIEVSNSWSMYERREELTDPGSE